MDTDTSAATLCDGDEVLLGAGVCVPAAGSVSFLALGATGQSLPSTTYSLIEFGVVGHNFGGAFNTSTSLFTAPLYGLYVFNFTLQITNVKNGTRVIITLLSSGTGPGTFVSAHRTTVAAEASSEYEIFSGSYMLVMNEGDSVGLGVNHIDGNEVTVGSATRFQGVRISP